ncbi:hypothetical protein [Methylobacterium sp. E-066]|uniref:hypothetical protein n=1 Tax=Methylobacterium sp. E-066 TaxID=2836584 RepID=UPI0028C3C88D|nr:hypothetical protein [Methylobacterium sp. E-066]
MNEVGRLLSGLPKIVAQRRTRQDALGPVAVLFPGVDRDLERIAMSTDLDAVAGKPCLGEVIAR